MWWLREELLHQPTVQLRHLHTQSHYWHSSPGLYKNFGPCLRKFDSEITEIFRSLFLDIRNKKTEIGYVTLLCVTYRRVEQDQVLCLRQSSHRYKVVCWGQLHFLHNTINDCTLIYSATLERQLRSLFPLLIFCSVDKKNQLDVTFCILHFSSNS